MYKNYQSAVIYPVKNDPQSVILYEELHNLGANPVLIPFKLSEDNQQKNVTILNKQIHMHENFIDVKSVYLRGLSTDAPLAAPPYMSDYEYKIWQAKYYKENLRISLINTFLNSMELNNVLIINSISSYLHHNSKASFNFILKKNKLNVPETFSTNDIEFIKKNIDKNKKYIFKSGSGVGATRRLTSKHLNTKSFSLKMTPALFQEEILGKTYRVHTVGNKIVLALEILADDIDSRTDTLGFLTADFNKKHEQQIVKANKIFGWNFSAWDVIIDEDDNLFLLDGNPGPYIYWIGDYLSRIVMKQLARFMSAYNNSQNLKTAENAVEHPEIKFNQTLKIENKIIPYVENLINSWKSELGLRY